MQEDSNCVGKGFISLTVANGDNCISHFDLRYVIALPSEDDLKKNFEHKMETRMVFLKMKDNNCRYVKCWTVDGKEYFFYNGKSSPISEVYRIISKEDFEEKISTEADPAIPVVEFIEYKLSYGTHEIYVEIYPFMKNTAFMHIAVCDPKIGKIKLPDGIEIIKEIDHEERFDTMKLLQAVINNKNEVPQRE